MKLNKLFMLGLAGLAFTACSNEDVVDNNTREDGRVRVTLSLGRTEGTRSVGQSADGLFNNVTDIKIIFYNAAGAYVAVPSQGNVGGIDYDNEDAINAAVKNGLLTSGHKVTVELKEVPSSASQIYIVANSEGKSNQIGTTSLTDARKTIIYLQNQIKEKYEVFSGEDSRMTGLAQIGSDGKANVTLRPAPSRIEMGKVTAVPVPSGDVWGGAEIESFTVDGFYINAFRTSDYLDGKALGLSEITEGAVDNGDDANNYSKAKYAEIKAEAGTGTVDWSAMCDEPVEGAYIYKAGTDTDDFIYSATTEPTTNWYGYMVLKGSPCDVVVKLNVKYADETSAVKFLTITKYKYTTAWTDYLGVTHAAGSDVKEFLRGHVYKLSDIRFDVTDLTDHPYETTKTVTADVEVAAWKGVPVEPGFN